MHTHGTCSPPTGVEKLSGVFMNDTLKWNVSQNDIYTKEHHVGI